MEKNKLNIAEQFQKWMEGSFNTSNVEVQVVAGWKDWDCKESSLKTKTDVLYRRLSEIIKSKRLTEYKLENLQLSLKTTQQTVGPNKDYICIKCINYCNTDFIICVEECLNHEDKELLTHCFIKNDNKEKTSFVGTWAEFVEWFNSPNKPVRKHIHKKEVFKYEEVETDLKDAAVNIMNRYVCYLLTDYQNGEKPEQIQIGRAVRYSDGKGTLIIGTLRLDIDEKEFTNFFLKQS